MKSYGAEMFLRTYNVYWYYGEELKVSTLNIKAPNEMRARDKAREQVRGRGYEPNFLKPVTVEVRKTRSILDVSRYWWAQ